MAGEWKNWSLWEVFFSFSSLIQGVLPFGAMFIELFFIFSAIWENQYYYLFGFLFLVFIIIISKWRNDGNSSTLISRLVSCSQISIVITYFQLCGEDYHWWWRSFIASGGSAFYIFAYSIFYFITKVKSSFDRFSSFKALWTIFQLDITEFVPSMLYFGYTFLICLTFWILTGTIGFIASYIFIRKIYAAVKIE